MKLFDFGESRGACQHCVIFSNQAQILQFQRFEMILKLIFCSIVIFMSNFHEYFFIIHFRKNLRNVSVNCEIKSSLVVSQSQSFETFEVVIFSIKKRAPSVCFRKWLNESALFSFLWIFQARATISRAFLWIYRWKRLKS